MFVMANKAKADWITESPQNYPYDVYYYACKHDTYNCDEIDYDYYKDGEFFYRYQPNDSEPCRYTHPWYIYNSDVPLDMTTGTWQVKEYRRSNRMFFCQSGSFVMQGETCNAPTSTPDNFTASTTETNITLAWDSVYNADFYNIARDTSTTTYATTSNLYFMDEDIVCDTVYNYFVQAENECGTSTFSEVIATSTPCANIEATSTPFNMGSGIEGFEFSDDLSIISGMTKHYSTTTASRTPDWVEYHYFHIPFFVWILLAVPSLWIAQRLIIEFLIRWRK